MYVLNQSHEKRNNLKIDEKNFLTVQIISLDEDFKTIKYDFLSFKQI